jgi:aspartyl/asparaginyl beta-hydroxylase (cupin superfamily)
MSDEVQRRLLAARELQKSGRVEEAAGHYRAILGMIPDHPVALNALGVQALGRDDPVGAEALLLRATAADPAAPDLWMNLAKARRMRSDDAGERAALDGALRCDQRHFMALVRLAELHERRDETGPAMERWTHVLAASSAMEPRPPQLDALFTHAQDYVTRMRGVLSASIEDGLAETRAGVPAAERRRFDACVDHAFGRRPVYRNECAGTYFPFLPAEEFFPRDMFPWAAELEARTPEIRAELEALLADGGAGIAPYVAMDPGTPQNKWSPLNHNLAWGALHLWRHGMRIDEACERAPRTADLLASLPMADMPRRTPTAFFSILKPRTHLPAHTGVSNTRTIVHLPLIVPPGCRFRVGGETREWREGECLFFDDTIEHEAWNDSDELRAVLIFDVWNPYLTETERELLRGFYRASDASGYGSRAQVSD